MKHGNHTLLKVTLLCLTFLSACNFRDKTLHGYVEGKLTFLSSPHDGKLTVLNVGRGTQVKAGEFLFSLDPLPEEALLKSASALANQAESNLKNLEVGKRPTEIEAIESQIQQVKEKITFLKTDNLRYKQLIQHSAVDRQRYDQSNQDLKVAINQLKELQADLSTAKLPARIDEVKAAASNLMSAQALHDKAKWDLKEKSGYAPKDSTVFDTYYKLGERISANQPVLSLLVPEDIIAVFFVPETLLSTIHIGDRVALYCDSCKSSIAGIIRYISPQAEYTPPVIYSNSARSKLVYRVEAEIVVKNIKMLNPGQPIDIVLHGN